MIPAKDLISRIDQISGTENKEDFKRQLSLVLEGMREVTSGFLKIARATRVIQEKRYYKELGYSTFDLFCREVLNQTRKTIYLYLRIDEVLRKYPEYFNETLVMELGTAKMDKIIIAINKIESTNLSGDKKTKRFQLLIESAQPGRSVGEIEAAVRKTIHGL